MFVIMASLLLWLAAFPKWILFVIGSWQVRRVQIGLLKQIIRANRNTQYGKYHHFEMINSLADWHQLPITEYCDYQDYISKIQKGEQEILTIDPVLLLEPTSGTSSDSKFIPYNQTLKKQFQQAIDAWIFQTYRIYPSLVGGKHYWALSPSSLQKDLPASKVPTAFADDTEYFPAWQKIIIEHLLAVPAEVSQITNPTTFQYLTLFFLLCTKQLRYISIWNPTFLTVLLEQFTFKKQELLRDIEQGTLAQSLVLDFNTRQILLNKTKPLPKRAKELYVIIQKHANPWPHIWPQLKVISAWGDNQAAIFFDALQEKFPNTIVERKGLLATEGVISLPFGLGLGCPAAFRSHFLEFIDCQTKQIYYLWQLEKGKQYSVVLTTGGGLYRYCLHDLVEVTSFYRQVPCLRFRGKDNRVVDLTGEKISEQQVSQILEKLKTEWGYSFAFNLLAPRQQENKVFYTLFIEPCSDKNYDFNFILSFLESELSNNFHYHHARNLGQLSNLKLFLIDINTANQAYLEHEQATGKRLGNIKPAVLSNYMNWEQYFQGQYYER
jgi:hypothetical protein